MQSLMRCSVFRNLLRTGLGYDFSSSNTASTSTTIFVPPINNVESACHNVFLFYFCFNVEVSQFFP